MTPPTVPQMSGEIRLDITPDVPLPRPRSAYDNLDLFIQRYQDAVHRLQRLKDALEVEPKAVVTSHSVDRPFIEITGAKDLIDRLAAQKLLENVSHKNYVLDWDDNEDDPARRKRARHMRSPMLDDRDVTVKRVGDQVRVHIDFHEGYQRIMGVRDYLKAGIDVPVGMQCVRTTPVTMVLCPDPEPELIQSAIRPAADGKYEVVLHMPAERFDRLFDDWPEDQVEYDGRLPKLLPTPQSCAGIEP